MSSSAKKHSWILALPPNSPKYFGNAIKQIAVESFCLSGNHKAVSVLANYLSINPRSLRRWASGELDSKHGRLTEDHFQELISLFWERGAVRSIDEILSLAYCAGEKYAIKAKATWLWDLVGIERPLLGQPAPRDARYPDIASIVHRETFMEIFLERVDFCLHTGQPLVIYGNPGIGKTSFMKYLEKEWMTYSKLSLRFPDGLLSAFLNGSAPDIALKIWLKDLIGDLDFDFSPVGLTNFLKQALSGARRIFLVDDVDNAEYARILMQANPRENLTVVTTASQDVATQLTLNRRARISMGGFTRDETMKFYEVLTGEDIPNGEEDELEALRDILNGNPLALFFAFKLLQAQKNDWQLTLRLLKADNIDYPEEITETVYLTQYRIYEKVLTAELQKYMRALGALPKFWRYDLKTFIALWNCDVDIALWVLQELENHGGLVQTAMAKEWWEVHGATIKIANAFLNDNLGESNFAGNWVKRGILLQEPIKLISLGDAVRQSYKVRRKIVPDEFRKKISAQDYIKQIYSYTGKNWSIVEKNKNFFSSDEYLQAATLREKEKQAEKMWRIFPFAWFFLAQIPLYFFSEQFIEARPSFTVATLRIYTAVVTFALMIGVFSILADFIRYPATWKTIIFKGAVRRVEKNTGTKEH